MVTLVLNGGEKYILGDRSHLLVVTAFGDDDDFILVFRVLLYLSQHSKLEEERSPTFLKNLPMSLMLSS